MDDPSSHHASGSTVQSFGSSITLPLQAKSTDLSSVSRAPSQGFDVRGGEVVRFVGFPSSYSRNFPPSSAERSTCGMDD